jgi:hypothetical protein
MSDEMNPSGMTVAEDDTLPMGVEVSKVDLLATVVDAEWKRPAGHVRTEGAPAEAYWCEYEGCRLRFERTGRIWQGFLDVLDAGETLETGASENIGKVARELKKLVEQWRVS